MACGWLAEQAFNQLPPGHAALNLCFNIRVISRKGFGFRDRSLAADARELQGCDDAKSDVLRPIVEKMAAITKTMGGARPRTNPT